MGRRAKHGSVLRVKTCRFRDDVCVLLDDMPDASTFIRQAVDEKLALVDDVGLQMEIEREKLRLRELEEIALTQKKSIDAKESRLQKHSLKRQGSQEIRIRWLTTLSRFGEHELISWLSSRVDVLSECGFKDVKEAVEWVKEKKLEGKK